MHKAKKKLGIIPARYASSRFPGKALIDINGKSMIQRVYEQAMHCKNLDQVVVATDDERIFNHLIKIGAAVLMTSIEAQSGTDRCAELADTPIFAEFDFIINIQGDEPFIQPTQIDKVVNFLEKNESIGIATLAKKIDDLDSLLNPNVVKVVFGKNNKALYFSRSTIPYLRGIEKRDWLEKGNFYKHIGLYGFKREILLELAKLKPSKLELTESLEQLRWLENGYSIGVELTELETQGIDTPEDLEKVLKYK